MRFSHSDEVWAAYPELVAGAVHATGIHSGVSTADPVSRFTAVAAARLAAAPESEFPEVTAWRRTFSRMGLKPTQYRCASESLLRRLRREGTLPAIHPLVDLCNAISVAYAIPVAALDAARIAGNLQVRPARGDERHLTFSGQEEHPEPGEITFVDEAAEAHARRWTNRQSGHSAVRGATSEVLIVAEAMHESAAEDVPKLIAEIADQLLNVWSARPDTAVLSVSSPRFEF